MMAKEFWGHKDRLNILYMWWWYGFLEPRRQKPWDVCCLYNNHNFFFKNIYFLEHQNYREMERQSLNLLVHSPNDYNGQIWTSQKFGAKSFFEVSHVGTGAQGLLPCSIVYPESGWKVQQPRLGLAPLWDASATSRELAFQTTVIASKFTTSKVTIHTGEIFGKKLSHYGWIFMTEYPYWSSEINPLSCLVCVNTRWHH